MGELFNKMFENFHSALSIKDSNKVDLFIQFLKFIKLYAYFFDCAIITESDPINLKRVFEVSTIPWLKTIDPPWFDYKPQYYSEKELLQMHDLLKLCFVNHNVTKRCLKILSIVFHQCNSPTWLIHIIRTALVSF